MTKNIEICKAEEVGAQVMDIRTTAERQAVAAINAAFGLAIPLPANEPGEITELPAAVSAHDRQLLAQTLGKPEPDATLSTTDPLATFVATLTRELYLHLADRQAVYLLADFPDLFARNLAHLLQAVQSLAPRKISNGSATNDGLPDGISLAHLLCGDYASVTEIIDDNRDWKMNTQFPWSAFPNLTKATFNCVESGAFAICPSTTIAELYLPYLVKISGDHAGILYADNNVIEHLYLPEFKGNYTYGRYGRIAMSCNALKDILMPKFEYVGGDNGPYNIRNCAALERVQMGKIVYNGALQWYFPGCPELIDVEIGAGTDVSLNLSGWNPTNVLADADKTATFLQNFRDHIALRLTDQGSGLTLTLSQAVRNAIHAAESTYGIEDIIVNQKHWTLSPAPSA